MKESLASFLDQKLSGFRAKTEFSRATGISKAVITQWTRGDVVPNFYSCLRIASYFNEDPVAIFGMAGRPEYLMEFERLMRLKRDPNDPQAVVSAVHRELHRKLQVILNSGPEGERVIRWNVEAIYDRCVATGKAHGKFPGR